MARGYDTGRLVIETKVIKTLIAGCVQPELLTSLLEHAREVAFRRVTVEAFNAFCDALPCILWQPEDMRMLVPVRVKREPDPVPIKVTRIIWTITHVCSLQGPELRGHEELHHVCGNNGKGSNAWGCCLNPAHMIRGGAEVRMDLQRVRKVMARRGLTQVSA